MGKRIGAPWRSLAAVAAVALVTGTTLAQAAEASKAQVVRDAETGQLRAPTAEEAQALREQSGGKLGRGGAAATSGQREIRHKNGTVEMQLDSSTVMYSVAQRQADGSLSRACVQGEEQAKAIGSAPRSFAKPLRAPAASARTARGAIYELQ